MSPTNGASGPSRLGPLRPGVYAPILTFFDQAEDLDLANQARHAVRLAQAGLAGLVVLGSNGEAAHLTPRERAAVICAVGVALDEASFTDLPLIAGCSAQGTRATLELCRDAAEAGASHAIILPPCYYKPAMTTDALERFYRDVADGSPLPVLMYNYPGAAAGTDMDSDLMARIAQHPNVRGAKLTCANTGKLTRLAAATDAVTPKHAGSGFLATGGLADMTVQSLVSGGSGVIAGTANVIPKFCVRVWELCVQGKMGEATEMQRTLAKADWELTRSGVGGTKAALEGLCGYGGSPRRPLLGMGSEARENLMWTMADALKVEKGL